MLRDPEGRRALDIVLVPGLWLDGPSWQRVAPLLERAGHRAHPVTLPGMERADADRASVTLQDQVDAVVHLIDSAAADGKIAVVGHSPGSGIATAAVDARPERVARVFYVGGFPAVPGAPLVDGFEAADGEIPLPDWSDFDDADIADLDDKARAEFRERAIPSPECVIRDPVRLSDERRHDVPATAVCPEYTAETLRGWIARGAAPVREFPRIRDLDYADLHSGHWPQFTRPEDLAKVILDRLSPAAAAR